MTTFSLILATVDRVKELERCLASLARQSSKDFEVIVVDQNTDGRLDDLIAGYSDQFPITHIKTSSRGLSRARNLGLTHIQGRIIGFTDDDCWYAPDTIELVAAWLDAHPEYAGLAGQSRDNDGNPCQNLWPSIALDLTWRSTWDAVISFGLFLRRPLIEAVGEFDENLGVGAATPWGSAEEADYVLRALKLGFRLRYEPGICIYHPQPVISYNAAAMRRGLLYGGGMGRVIRKHKLPLYFFARSLYRALGGAVLGLLAGNLGQSKFHLHVLQGRWKGWHSTK